MATCTRCSREVSDWDGVEHSDGKGGSHGFVCGRCWTQIMSEHTGEDLGHLEVEPIILEDATGQAHEFHFRYNPVPRMLEAFELQDDGPGGYEFGVMAEEDESNVAMVGRLLVKIRTGLSRQHLVPTGLPQGGLCIKDMTVRGRIEPDMEKDDRTPCLVIDGKTISWDLFGKILMNMEGWQFRLEILDKTDEV